METNRREKRLRARKRVEELKGFYVHSTVYVLVNLFIITISVTVRMNNGEGFAEAIFDFGNFVTPFFWGIGLMFHAIRVFSLSPFLGKDWEARQIQKYMEEDRREAERFNRH